MITKEARKKYNKKYRDTHKESISAYNHLYNEKHQEIRKEKRRLYGYKYRKEHKEQIARQQHLYHIKNRAKRLAYHDNWRKEHPGHIRMIQRNWRIKLKKEVLTQYGNGECACLRCGESRLACLSLDHITGGGNEHRRKGGLGGMKLYLGLRKSGFPKGIYQTLCMNCQFVKRVEEIEYGDKFKSKEKERI